jgi:hypothetical protein
MFVALYVADLSNFSCGHFLVNTRNYFDNHSNAVKKVFHTEANTYQLTIQRKKSVLLVVFICVTEMRCQ